MRKLSYRTRSSLILENLEKQLADNRISEREFEVLLGLLIEKEFSDNLKHQMHHIIPVRRHPHSFSFINYEWKHTHAN